MRGCGDWGGGLKFRIYDLRSRCYSSLYSSSFIPLYERNRASLYPTLDFDFARLANLESGIITGADQPES